MRVALLKPPVGRVLGLEMITFAEPLGLMCLGAVLEQAGHECLILDLRIDGEAQGLQECAAFAPGLVGVQCNFTTERHRTARLVRKVQALLPETTIVVGGHDASREPEWFNDPAIDAVVIGDGEEVIAPLAAAVEQRSGLDHVAGLVINRKGGRHVTVPAVPRADLDTLPLPARHLTARYADHYYINFRRPLALLETARGCPFKCTFCSVWKFHHCGVREKSPSRVVEELRTISAPNVFITDDIFWLNPRRSTEMARLIMEAGIRKYFTVQTRTDVICHHPEVIETWKGCGSLAIFLGLEAVTDQGLASINKRSKADTNLRAIEILKKLGVGFTPNFIVDPDWDHDDFARLRDWIDRNGAFNSGFSVLTPLPGTDLWSAARERVVTFDWDLYDLIHTVLPTRLSLEDFYQEVAKLWHATIEVRFRHRSRARTYLQMVGALATGKVTAGALRKGMNIARVLSDPETFLSAHRGSPDELAPNHTAIDVPD